LTSLTSSSSLWQKKSFGRFGQKTNIKSFVFHRGLRDLAENEKGFISFAARESRGTEMAGRRESDETAR
jgi:hypothetical protein